MMGQIFEQLLAEINSDTEEVVDKNQKKLLLHTQVIVDEILSHWLRILKVTMIKILLENSILTMTLRLSF